MPVDVRARRPQDLPGLLALLQRTHEQEGYPVRSEAVSDGWLASEDELGGWVADADDRVVGHVALHPADDPAAVPLWQRTTGRDPDGLAVVSRLFTDRTVPGAGLALVRHAVAEAALRGRTAVLLVDPDSAARGWYLRHGWAEVGTARQQWGPRTVDAVLMVQTGSAG
ncbi:MAG: hypothetical protein JWM64_2121 [Frankiales bacterium]|nr:hypothetical protein [Frankiales bacterium]